MIINRLNKEIHPYPKERQLYRKNKRDLKAIKEFKKKYSRCTICGKESVSHHIRSRGAGGADSEKNLMPLCVKHHFERHVLGRRRFNTRYKAELKYWPKNSKPPKEKNGSK